jgi:hypothetical protein
MNIINLTPHEIVVVGDGATKILPSGAVARVTTTRQKVAQIGEIPIYRSVTGAVTGLPESVDGTVYIVSAMVRLAVPSRTDIVSPGELVRDASGQPIGCRGFDGN